MKYRTRRKPTDFDVTLLTEESAHPALVLDVNDQGVRVRVKAHRLEVEDDVLLELRGRKFATRVAWFKGDEIGLQFDTALPQDIQALISRDRKKTVSKRFLFR